MEPEREPARADENQERHQLPNKVNDLQKGYSSDHTLFFSLK